jgi:serine/threonine protein kinase
LNYQIDYDEKICHGDLHTDNFFIDEKGVYLIDFGFTGKHYSLIDYTALECSLKFKHCPLYLESGELIKIENELLSENSFLLNHTFSSTTRKEILDLLSMINTIRNNSIKDSIASKNNLDYYISLFIMTIRQIKYPNMNQLYAYHSAKILSEYIIKQIGV